MIERKYNLHAPVLDFFNGWTSAIIISLAVHGAMIWAVIVLSGDISKPYVVKAFNVEVVLESAPEKQYDAIKTKIKHIKTETVKGSSTLLNN